MSAGGKREGSGRKALGPNKRQHISVYVAHETVQIIRELRRRRVNIGRELDRYFEERAKMLTDEK